MRKCSDKKIPFLTLFIHLGMPLHQSPVIETSQLDQNNAEDAISADSELNVPSHGMTWNQDENPPQNSAFFESFQSFSSNSNETQYFSPSGSSTHQSIENENGMVPLSDVIELLYIAIDNFKNLRKIVAKRSQKKRIHTV